MKFLRWALVFIVAAVISANTGVVAHAANKQGLTLSPVRAAYTMGAGKSKSSKVTIVNNTPEDMDVSLSVESFSAANGSYDLRFRPADYDWVELKDSKLNLKPGEKAVSQYTVRVSPGASVGGYYFAVIASMVEKRGDTNITLRAAMPLYITVDSGGKLWRTSELADIKMPRLVTGEEFPFSFDVENKGNVHITGKFTVRIDSLWGDHYEQSEQHAVFPGSIRTISGALQAPLIPGLYQLTYGYGDIDTHDVKTKTTYFVSLPSWSIVTMILLVVLYIAYRVNKHYGRHK